MFEFKGKKWYTKQEFLEIKVEKLKELEVKLIEIVAEIVSESQKVENILKWKEIK